MYQNEICRLNEEIKDYKKERSDKEKNHERYHELGLKLVAELEQIMNYYSNQGLIPDVKIINTMKERVKEQDILETISVNDIKVLNFLIIELEAKKRGLESGAKVEYHNDRYIIDELENRDGSCVLRWYYLSPLVDTKASLERKDDIMDVNQELELTEEVMKEIILIKDAEEEFN